MNDFRSFRRGKREQGFEDLRIFAHQAVYLDIAEIQDSDRIEGVADLHPLDQRVGGNPDMNVADLGSWFVRDELDNLERSLVGVRYPDLGIGRQYPEILFQVPGPGKKRIGDVLLQGIGGCDDHLLQFGKIHGQGGAVTEDDLLVRLAVIPQHLRGLAGLQEIGLTAAAAPPAGELAAGLLGEVEGKTLDSVIVCLQPRPDIGGAFLAAAGDAGKPGKENKKKG